MKTSINGLNRIAIALIVMKICLFNSFLMAQRARGIYLSAHDFIANKTAFTAEGDKKYKIKLHDFSFQSPIRISYGDSVIKLSKDSVYGFKDEEGVSYRFFNKEVYTILNPTAKATILLYNRMISARTKYEEAVYSYYFSKDEKSAVLPLTINNLETCFKSNNVFIELLNVHFINDEELPEYDSHHKMYKINYLMELSKNKTN